MQVLKKEFINGGKLLKSPVWTHDEDPNWDFVVWSDWSLYGWGGHLQQK
jgi:hypothetical protein